MRFSRTSFLVICFLLVSCDSQFEIKVEDEPTVNQICLTDIFGGDDEFWDLSNIKKDCRKGEIITESVFLTYENVVTDLLFYERRLNYLISKICDFDKQIIVQKLPVNSKDDMHIYDLTCVYSGGFDFPGTKWIEEMKDKE